MATKLVKEEAGLMLDLGAEKETAQTVVTGKSTAPEHSSYPVT
jgi:hypothetical protein